MRSRTIAILATFILIAAPSPHAGARSPSGADTVSFAGYDWDVKSSLGQVGPGPNVFAADNVKVDRRGRLHMRIDEQDGVWRSAEVILDQALGYGTYRFSVNSSLDSLDPSVVLGLFTWSDAIEQHNRELDIEFSRWSDPDNAFNAGYTVQPYDEAGHQHQWKIDSGRRTEHEMTWTADSVTFKSTRNGRLLDSWVFDDVAAIPDPATAHARINLWLFRGAPPTDGREVHLVISDFEFTGP